MGIDFTVNENDDTILIQASNTISTEEIRWMRSQTVDLLEKTGIKNYVVDLAKVSSIGEQSTHITYKLGKEFKRINFPLSTKTAVILPEDQSARKQAEFLHTVEINRMRGPLKYVSSYQEALEWFNS